MSTRTLSIAGLEPRSLTRLNPEQALLQAEGRAERLAARRVERCPHRDAADDAFNAWLAADPHEARAWAAVKASANLPPQKFSAPRPAAPVPKPCSNRERRR